MLQRMVRLPVPPYSYIAGLPVLLHRYAPAVVSEIAPGPKV